MSSQQRTPRSARSRCTSRGLGSGTRAGDCGDDGGEEGTLDRPPGVFVLRPEIGPNEVLSSDILKKLGLVPATRFDFVVFTLGAWLESHAPALEHSHGRIPFRPSHGILVPALSHSRTESARF